MGLFQDRDAALNVVNGQEAIRIDPGQDLVSMLVEEQRPVGAPHLTLPQRRFRRYPACHNLARALQYRHPARRSDAPELMPESVEGWGMGPCA